MFFQKNVTAKPVRQPLLAPLQKWLSWTGGGLIKHLFKTTTNQIWLFLAGF